MPMACNRIYNIWKASGDADIKGGAGLQMYTFTHDHFNLDAFSKMRVILAVQITPQTTIRMIKDHCENDPIDNIADFAPMIKLFNRVDKLIDIMNGCDFSKGKTHDVQIIDEQKQGEGQFYQVHNVPDL